jgi:hypothetical protein
MGYEKSGESCNGAPPPLAQLTVAEWIVCSGLVILLQYRCNTPALRINLGLQMDFG